MGIWLFGGVDDDLDAVFARDDDGDDYDDAEGFRRHRSFCVDGVERRSLFGRHLPVPFAMLIVYSPPAETRADDPASFPPYL